jgi:hypothetical protein
MSQISKLGYVDNKLGAPSSGQQTTRILFNTIEAPGTTSSLSFFKSFQGLSNGQTNLTQNKLDSMESMVIKTIWLAQFDTAGAVNPVGGVVPQTISIIVGNQTVVKNLPIFLNQGTNAQAFDRLHDNAGAAIDIANVPSDVVQKYMPCEIRLLTDVVIPPQVAFEVRLDSNQAVYGTGAVVCALSGYGKIFSAGNTF